MAALAAGNYRRKGWAAELFGDWAKMNIRLHNDVLPRIAGNGGNVPKNLLD